MTPKQKKKRMATAGAIVLMLGVMHISTRDANGTPDPTSKTCIKPGSNPPLHVPCPPGPTTTTSTVVITVKPLPPGPSPLPPPIEGHPITVPTPIVVPISPPPVVVEPVTVAATAAPTTTTTEPAPVVNPGPARKRVLPPTS